MRTDGEGTLLVIDDKPTESLAASRYLLNCSSLGYVGSETINDAIKVAGDLTVPLVGIFLAHPIDLSESVDGFRQLVAMAQQRSVPLFSRYDASDVLHSHWVRLSPQLALWGSRSSTPTASVTMAALRLACRNSDPQSRPDEFLDRTTYINLLPFRNLTVKYPIELKVLKSGKQFDALILKPALPTRGNGQTPSEAVEACAHFLGQQYQMLQRQRSGDSAYQTEVRNRLSEHIGVRNWTRVQKETN